MGGIESLRHYAIINNLLDMEVSIAPIREFLQGAMSEEKLNQGFLRGRITIGTLQPMRSIPRKVVYLLGMNEGDFPRKDIKLTFNLLEKKPVLCQREMQAEDRYLFLEAIMSARKKLIVSYIGQNIKSNEEEPPAVVLSELMDYVGKYFPISINDLITKHPLQPFNPNYFTGTNPNLFSFSKEDYDVALKLISKKEGNNRFICNPPLREKVITIDELIAFYENPIKSLFNRLSAYIPPLDREIKDLEDLEENALSKYSMYNKMVETLVKKNLLAPNDDEEKTNNILNKLYSLSTKKLEWPIGSYGKIVFDKNKEDFLNKIIKIAPNNENILELKKQCTEKINIEIPLNNSLSLVGTVDNISINGDNLAHLNFRYTTLKGKDLIRGIIKHTILSVATDKEVTTYIQGSEPTPKKNYILENSRANRQEHNARLTELINFYLDTQPTPIFPNAAYAYAINKNERLKKAKDAAQPNFDKSGTAELLDEYISLCYNSTVFDDKNEMKKFIDIVKVLFKEIDDTIDEESEEENKDEAKSEQPK
jgi:exodeoxyribonuclease V gamma subunit